MEKVNQFFSKFRQVKYAKGEIVCGPETIPEGLFYLESGLVKQNVLTIDGDELTVNLFKPGAFFPVGWIINDEKIRHSYIAAEDVVVRLAPKKEALEFVQDKDVMWDLLRRIYKGLDGFFLRMEQMMAGTSRNKIIAQLLILARRFDGKDIKMTEEELASLAGVARETVSRQITDLKRANLIAVQDGGYKVLDSKKLEQELGM